MTNIIGPEQSDPELHHLFFANVFSCGSSLAWDTCEMPSSAPVDQAGFLPPLINDRLDISAIFLKGP